MIVILLLSMCAESSNGQTFLKYFALDSVSTIGYSLVSTDSFLYVCGTLVDSSNGAATKSFMAKFDNNGNMLSSNTYRPLQYLGFYIIGQNGLIKTSDGGMAAAGFVVDTNGIDSVCFTRFDSVGNLLYYRTYAPNITNYRHTYGFQVVEYEQAYYILGNVQLQDYYVALLLIKVDVSGNLQFIKTYQNLPLLYDNSNGSICGLHNNKLLLVDEKTDGNINYWQTNYSSCYLQVDTGGNLLHQYCTSDSNTQASWQLATTYDGNYLSCGSYYQLRGQSEPAELDINYLLKLDTNFNTIWQLKTGSVDVGNTFMDFKQDGNNNIILCGQDLIGTVGSSMMEDVIYKVDPVGNVLWSRHYMVPTGLNPDYSSNYLCSVHLLPHGDIAGVGTWIIGDGVTTSPLYFLETAVLLRVDSNGCLGGDSCGLSTEIDEMSSSSASKAEPLSVFPNPSNGIFTISSSHALPAATTLDVYDELGRKLNSQLLFNHTNVVNLYYLPSGIYFYKIGNGLVNVGEGKLVIQK